MNMKIKNVKSEQLNKQLSVLVDRFERDVEELGIENYVFSSVFQIKDNKYVNFTLYDHNVKEDPYSFLEQLTANMLVNMISEIADESVEEFENKTGGQILSKEQTDRLQKDCMQKISFKIFQKTAGLITENNI